MKKIFLTILFLGLLSFVIFLTLKNINNQKIINKFNSENNITCPQVDQYFNTQNGSKTFKKNKLLPVDTRLVFHNPSSLAINAYEFTSVFTNKIEKTIVIFGLKENGFYSDSYSPMIYDVEGDQNSSTVPFSSIFPNYFEFQFFESPNIAIGIGDQWYVFTQSICDYGSVCKQIIYKFGSRGLDISPSGNIPPETIKIPEKYLNSFDSIDGTYNDNIIFKQSDKKLVSYDTVKNIWQDFPSDIKYAKLNSVENVMKKYGCFYYPAYQGDVVFYKHNLFSAGYPDFKWVDIFYSKR